MTVVKQPHSHTMIHIDGLNLFHRQIHMTNPALGIDNAIGMALHLILYSMKKEYTTWKGSHAVFYLEGHSWRKHIYPPYKANRKVVKEALTEKEREDFEILKGAFDDFSEFIRNKTNISVIQNPNAEADDLIAVFIESHPNDTHVLISSDSDFYQLLKFSNVIIYDPIKDIRITRDGIHNDKGKRLAFMVDTTAKIKVGKEDPTFVCDPDWYNYALFLKCVRGDKSDNIFSAYPGVREKGTKTSIGIREAYLDTEKGYAWNNFMLQKFSHHDGTEHKVKDDFDVNSLLIDLSRIPDNIKMECLQTIATATEDKNIKAVDIGHAFMKFCGRWNLPKIANNVGQFMPILLDKYTIT